MGSRLEGVVECSVGERYGAVVTIGFRVIIVIVVSEVGDNSGGLFFLIKNNPPGSTPAL